MDCTILYVSVGGTCLLNLVLFQVVCWKKCSPAKEKVATGLKMFKKFPVSRMGTVSLGPIRTL